MIKPNRNVWLWWMAAVSLSIGTAVYFVLKPITYDVQIQRFRSMILIAGIFVAGLCVIIGTSRRWFGKDL
ncbi:MAG: hypothetical protein MUC65_08690 [Pontiellaceae bacterium]|jgi:hypothetical protein|nr:hypothetical protein [Pontiellaceae bacterium]